MKMYQKIFLGLILGAVVGHFLGENSKYLKPIGDIFINLIKLVVIPLIFFSVLTSIISFSKSSSLARTGGKATLFYFCTTIVAIALGLIFANLFNPSEGLGDLNMFNIDKSKIDISGAKSIKDTIIGIIPTNPVKAFADGNAIQLIVLAVFIGLAINSLGDKTKNLVRIIKEIDSIIFFCMDKVIALAPIGVFALIAFVAGTQDPDALLALVKFVVVVISACLFHVYVIYPMVIYSFTGLNPFIFFRKIINAQIFAFSTSSSSATLPTTMKVAREKLGISDRSTDLILPLGATINMDGGAIFLGICTVFVAGLSGVDISTNGYILIVVNSLLISVGTAGVPGASLILMSIIFNMLGLPLEAIGYIIGVDRILDMFRTSTNVTGDLVVATIVDHSEKTFNKKIFYGK